MFRENPDFIVAGEIVRTTRMYAMSVSPCPGNFAPHIANGAERLSAISGGQAGRATSAVERRAKARGGRKGRRRQAPRSFTDTIQLGARFSIW
jgi:hypothetical protein